MIKIINNLKYHLYIFVFLFCFCVLLLIGRMCVTGNAIGGDAVYYYSTLRSLAVDRDLDFTNEFQYFHNSTSKFTNNRKIPVIPSKNPKTQKYVVIYPIGAAIFLLPAFTLTHQTALFLQKLGLNIPTDGFAYFYQAQAAFSSLLYATFGLILVYLLGKKFFDPKIALIGTIGIWFATPLVYYMTQEPLNSQPISVFATGLFFYFWYKIRNNSKAFLWIVLGLIGGLMTLVRFQDGLFILIPIIDSLRKINKTIFLFLITVFLVITPQLAVNNYLYGSFFITGYGGTLLPNLLSPKIFYSLFSLQRGLLIWSPILFFSFIGLYFFTKKNRFLGSLFILSFFIQLYITSSWADPTQGDSFGNRILINSTPIFSLGLMQFLKDAKIRLELLLIIISIFILTNGILAALFIFRIIGQPY